MRDLPVHPPFPWRCINGDTEECHVVIRERDGEPTVHILSLQNGKKKSSGIYFHVDELDNIIAALSSAKNKLK